MSKKVIVLPLLTDSKTPLTEALFANLLPFTSLIVLVFPLGQYILRYTELLYNLNHKQTKDLS